MTARLYVAARAPRPGLNKTRLARAIGDDAACGLYRAFLRDLAARLRARGLPLGWYVTPADGWDEVAEVIGPGAAPEPVLVQPEGDWTERQRRLLRGGPARGESATALIASDSPHLDLGEVARALALLERGDLVLGPVADGGYYLIGMRGWHDVLAGVPMSEGDVTGRILAAARRMGVKAALIAPTFDVDVAGDLPALAAAAYARRDLPATRQALGALDPFERAA